MFIVKKCPHLMNSAYADGREVCNECGDSSADKKCCEVESCLFKQIVENLLKVVRHGLCSRCDGIGYEEGCLDDECGTYEAYKCLDLLDVEFIDEDESNLENNA